MILVHWKVRTGDEYCTPAMSIKTEMKPVYMEGNQKFHAGVSYEHVVDFIALHQEVEAKDVIICNVIHDDDYGIRIRGRKES